MCNSVPQKLPKCLFPISFTSCSQRSNYALEWFVNHSHAFLSFNIVLRFNHVNALVFAYSFFFSIYYLTVWTYHHLSILLLMNFGLFPVGIFVCLFWFVLCVICICTSFSTLELIYEGRANHWKSDVWAESWKEAVMWRWAKECSKEKEQHAKVLGWEVLEC